MKTENHPLSRYMSELSEKYFKSEWDTGLEVFLWEEMAYVLKTPLKLSSDECLKLRKLSNEYDCWFAWEGDLKLIDLKSWRFLIYYRKNVENHKSIPETFQNVNPPPRVMDLTFSDEEWFRFFVGCALMSSLPSQSIEMHIARAFEYANKIINKLANRRTIPC